MARLTLVFLPLEVEAWPVGILPGVFLILALRLKGAPFADCRSELMMSKAEMSSPSDSDFKSTSLVRLLSSLRIRRLSGHDGHAVASSSQG